MEGNPADLTIYRDVAVGFQKRDHTYIGNGCPGGSGTASPCSTRIIKDGNDEDQKNGTYYHFQAATAGSGGAIETDNANAPDTFCPLGWQLPYSGTGGDYYDKSKSWRNLFNTYGITYDDGGAAQATKIRSYPFSYVLSGSFIWDSGLLFLFTEHALYWSSSITSDYTSYRLNSWANAIRPANPSGKANGNALRCFFLFIDGTVEGTNIVISDGLFTHDHVYYGYGCAVSFDHISSVSCNIKTVNTSDGEPLSIGALYN